MKNLFLSVLILPGLLFSMHHEKNPIIFYLDLEIADGKSDGVEEFVDYLVAAVNETEPKTMYYKYWISEDKKNVSLMEVYHSNEDAIFHMNAFAEAPHRDKFLETFIVQSFQVLGDTNDDLKNAMEAYTNDNRTLMNGFQRKNK
jgi:quinol monooxygenase YgiN